MKHAQRITLLLGASLLMMSAQAQMQHDPAQHSPHAIVTDTGATQEVNFPPLVKRNTLATMRMHLQGLAEIQQALAESHFDEAAQIATMKLGMSSMHGNQMTEGAKYMPPGMKQLGARVHQQAGEFAVAAQDANVTGDIRKPLLLLSQITQTCVACHATYRLH
jgi:hypothetical protein